MTLGIYIHYPYCARRCPYCDFNVEVSAKVPQSAYADAVLNELATRLRDSSIQGPAVSVYFGGGTPSLWPAQEIARVLEGIREQVGLSPNAELSLELNPEDGQIERLRSLRSVGITRLSIGAQSFRPEILRFLGRKHRSVDIEMSVRNARLSGFDNISIDLIFGVAGQTLLQALDDAKRACSLDVEHVSFYELTIENGTRFEQRTRRGESLTVDENTQLAMTEALRELLNAHGLVPYELLSAARPGFECVHNQLYWSYQWYLALGAGAHGFIPLDEKGIRYVNIKPVTTYMDACASGAVPEVERNTVSEADALEERIITGLRLTRGVVVDGALQRAFGGHARGLEEKGLLFIDESHWKLTQRGRAVADSVVLELVAGP